MTDANQVRITFPRVINFTSVIGVIAMVIGLYDVLVDLRKADDHLMLEFKSLRKELLIKEVFHEKEHKRLAHETQALRKREP